MTFPTTTGKGSNFNGAGVASVDAMLGTVVIDDFAIVVGAFDPASTSTVSISNGLGDIATFDIAPTDDAFGVVKHFAARIPSLTHPTSAITMTFSGGTLPTYAGFSVWTGNGLAGLTLDKSSYATGTGTRPNSGTTATLDNADDVAVAFAWSGSAPENPSAPSQVLGLTAAPISTTQIDLTWTASTDDVGVTGYHISRDGVLLTTVTSTGYSDTGLMPGTAYAYQVTATDLAGNVSVAATASATTTAVSVTTATDNFNRADGALGSNWSNISLVGFSGNPQIISNQVGMTVGSNQSIACWTADSFANDQWCELSVPALGAYVGLAVRCDVLSGSAYGAYLSPNGSNTDLTFLIWTNGAFLNLSPQTVLARLLVSADIVRLEVTGQTLTLKINGATVYTHNDATLTSGSPGIAFFNTDARGDNFKAGPVVAPPPPLPPGLYVRDDTQVILPSGALKIERTQPWTAIAAIQIIDQDFDFGSIIFSNVNDAPFTGYELWAQYNGTMRVRIINSFNGGNLIEVDTPTFVADGLLHMVAATYDGSSTAAGVSIYVDGIKQTTTIGADNLTGSIVSGAGDMWIANQNFAHGPPFGLQGVMSFLAFSNVVRDAAYMSAHASLATKPAVDANTTLYFDFTEGSGTTLTDKSANGYNATISGTGAAWIYGIDSPWVSDGKDSIDNWYGHRTLTADTGISATFTATDRPNGALVVAYKSDTVTHYTLTADKGIFALTGQAAITRYGRVVKAVQGTLALTGRATGLRYGRVTTAAKGTFTLNGQAAILRYGHKVTAAPGAFALTGQAAFLRYTRVALTADKGTFALTGSAAGLIYSTARVLPAFTGTFTLSGQTATLRYARKPVAATGVFALTGQAAFLRYTRVALTADKGTFALTGNAAGLIYGTARVLTASTGTFTLSGQTATLRYARKVAAAAGVFALTGQAATLRYGRVTTAAKGTFTLGGQAARLRFGHAVTAAQGTFALSGQAATLRYSRVGVAAKGAFLLSGAPVNLIYSADQNVKLSAATGSFALAGQAARLRFGHAVTAAQGTFTLAGQAATLRYARAHKAECGVFVLHGRWADLIYNAAPPFVPSEDRTAFTLEDAQRLGITVADESRLAFTVQ